MVLEADVLALSERIRDASEKGEHLRIKGHGSRGIALHLEGDWLEMAPFSGVICHRQKEMVLTAWAGTPLAEIEKELALAHQMLPFEAPMPQGRGTLGGAVAAGLSGASRPYRGSVRDAILGVKLMDGRGQRLSFGGEVLKNVAGFDVGRFMTGGHGAFGVLLALSLRLLPLPESETSLVFSLAPEEAMQRAARWHKEGWPITAALADGENLHLRLSGRTRAVREAARALGAEESKGGIWRQIQEERHPVFSSSQGLFRIHRPPLSRPLELSGKCLTLWEGAMQYLRTEASKEEVRNAVAMQGGHALEHRGLPHVPAAQRGILRRLKEAFDPALVLNFGILGP